MVSGIRTLLAALVLLAHSAGPAGVPVTIDNFRRAETDHYFLTYAGKGCFGKLCNERGPAPVDKQDVVRMNRDTPYSVGIFDLTSPLTITKPNTGSRESSPFDRVFVGCRRVELAPSALSKRPLKNGRS